MTEDVFNNLELEDNNIITITMNDGTIHSNRTLASNNIYRGAQINGENTLRGSVRLVAKNINNFNDPILLEDINTIVKHKLTH